MNSPDNPYDAILSMFLSTKNVELKDLKEDLSEVKISFSLNLEKIPTLDEYRKVIDYLNKRDFLHFSILKDGSILENFKSKEDSFSVYIQTLINLGLSIGNEIEIIITIIKNRIEDTISVYFYEEFVKYLKGLSFGVFLNVLEKYVSNNKLVLEYQSNKLTSTFLKTKAISFISKNFEPSTVSQDIEFRTNRITQATAYCHWDNDKRLIVPDDLNPIISLDNDKFLVQLFQKASILITTSFIFDYLSLKNEQFSFKLNGYRTYSQVINTKTLDSINVDYESADLMYQIYFWCYQGGNTSDKIYIARNIISLNFDPETLSLKKTTFDAILSNYKIYERENVKQYIEIRNKLSELLIDLQAKIDKIIDGFTGDFKRNILTLISFFISVIAIRVISKGDFIGGFTNEIIILAFSLLIISVGLLIYSRWELTQRISMYEKHYEQLRERYKELLSPGELDTIFNHCDPQKSPHDCNFVTRQKLFYSLVWIGSIVILALSLLLFFFINNFDSVIFMDNLLNWILCCTKNI